MDARLFEIIVNLVGIQGLELDNKMIWESVKANIEGYYDYKKPLSYETEELYTLSQRRVTDILADKFLAVKGHDSKTGKNRALRFNQNTLNRSGSVITVTIKKIGISLKGLVVQGIRELTGMDNRVR